MKLKKLLTIFLLKFCAACALAPASTGPTEDDGPIVVGTQVQTGLPIVDAPVFAFAESDSAVRSEKASTEPFICTDENGGNCRRPRQSWTTTDIRPSIKHTIWGTGEPGHSYARYSVRNIRNQGYTLTSHPAGGSLNWWFEYPLGHPCRRTDSYNPQDCTWDICLVSGTPWPRCISTQVLRGATQAFQGETWSPYETLVFEVFSTAHGTPVPSTATFEQILLFTQRHYPLTPARATCQGSYMQDRDADWEVLRRLRLGYAAPVRPEGDHDVSLLFTQRHYPLTPVHETCQGSYMQDRDAAIEWSYTIGKSSLRQIADAHGVSHEKVRTALIARGVTLRTKGEGVRARKAHSVA